jgi:hypothetical protein
MFLFFILGCIEQSFVDTGYCNQSVSDIAVGLTQEQREVSHVIENELKEMDIPDNIIAASIVNAVAESNLNPNAAGDGGDSIGAFQLNINGLGKKLTIDERQNLYTTANIVGIQILKNDKLFELEQRKATIPELTALFAQYIMNPSNIEKNKFHRTQLAKKMFPERI